MALCQSSIILGIRKSNVILIGFHQKLRNHDLRVTIDGKQPGLEPMVRPIRFWPGHFLLGARPLLVNAWDYSICKETTRTIINSLIINTSLEKKIPFQCFICFVLLKVLIFTGS